jgi:type I restriction enzyme, S subunit
MTSTGIGIELSIDKTNWKPVCLGDVVDESREVVRDPVKEGIEKVVGLEHIDSESIHLRRWETLEQSTTFTKKFVKGQVLFGRRRAYLKKAALAPFDGICSGDITVLEAKEDLLPELLPFLINNDKFFDFAIKNSAGSLSPRAKFKDIANYEFLLPPKDQQARLAELLWAADEVVENYHNLENKLQFAYSIAVDKVYSGLPNLSLVELSTIAQINSESLKNSTAGDYKFKYLDIASIIEPKILGELQWYNFSQAPSRARRVIKDGDIVISLVRPYHNSFVIVDDATNVIASTGTGVISVNDEVNNKFIFHQFFSNRFSEFCKERMTGTNYPAITPRDLAEFKVFYSANLKEQEMIAIKLDSLDMNSKLAKSSLYSSRQLQKSLINQIF